MSQSKLAALLFVSSMFVGCASDPLQALDEKAPLSNHQQQTKTTLLASYDKWQGTPYRLGGTNARGIDCSAFVQQVFSEFEQNHPNALELPRLPRTTELQWQASYEVKPSESRVGDLVFFKTGFKQWHVGVYMGKQEFMHASTSRGVIISSMTSPYWQRHFESFRRPFITNK